MKKSILVILITVIFGGVHAQKTNNEDLIEAFDKLLMKEFKPDEPGAVVLVSKKGHVVYKKAFGIANLEFNIPMQVDNVFWIASIGKQFTAIAILQLIEQGKLSLQDEITKFLPDYPTQGTKITIEHLLTHTSGIHNFSGMSDPEKKLALDCTPQEVIDFFKNLPMQFSPGTKWEYNNSGYFLLGYIIEKVTNIPYPKYIEEKIFKPLGMSHTLYASDRKIIKNRVGAYTFTNNGFLNTTSRNITNVYSAGAIQSTVDDFFKWQQAILSYQLVKKETLDKAFSRYTLKDGTKVDYGYGWRLGYVYESPSIWHGGLISGFGTMELYLPEQDVFVAVFSNCDCYYPKDITLKLAALAIGKPTEYKETIIDQSKLKEYVGLYENQKGQRRIITLSDNQLYSQIGRGPKSKIKPYKIDQFFFPSDLYTTIAFSRNTNASITTLTTNKLEGNDVWLKSDQPIPDSNGINVDKAILETYVGRYEIPSVMSFSIRIMNNRLVLEVNSDNFFELFADSINKFFTKVNDAEFEFIKDSIGQVSKIILRQGGRTTEAKRVQ
ncbi:MAG: serine hydrolase [Chitinophagaceae bacterium]|nr:serine hydrolase [Chitinophagaceae bacterium]